MTAEYTGALKILYDWQTLAAGLLAVIAGLTTLWAAKKQIASSRKLREEEIKSNRLALLKKMLAVMDEFGEQLGRMSGIQGGSLIPKPDIDAPWRDAIFNEIGILDVSAVIPYVELYGKIGAYKKAVGKNMPSGGLPDELKSIRESVDKVSSACKEAAANLGVFLGRSE